MTLRIFLNFSLNLPFFAAKSRHWRGKHHAMSRMSHLNVAPLHLSWPCILTCVHRERLQAGSSVYMGKRNLWATQQKKVSGHSHISDLRPNDQPWFLLRMRGSYVTGSAETQSTVVVLILGKLWFSKSNNIVIWLHSPLNLKLEFVWKKKKAQDNTY